MAARRLVLTRAAERDLEQQVDFIAATRPVTARRYLAAVQSTCDRLLELPELGARRRYRSVGYEPVRIWPVPGFRRFVIVYRATQRTVEIIRVLHTARDVSRTRGGR